MSARLRWTTGAIAATVVLVLLLARWLDGRGPPHWFASAVAFSPDGKQLVVGTYRWQRIPPPDTPRFLIGGVSQSVRVLDPRTGSLLRRVEEVRSSQIRRGTIPEPVSWISFSADGTNAVVGHWEGEVARYKTSTWESVDRFSTGDGSGFVQGLGFLEGDEDLWIAYRHFVVMQSLHEPRRERYLAQAASVHSTSISDDGRLLAVGGIFGEVAIFDLKTSQRLNSFRWNATTGDLSTNHEGTLAWIDCEFVPGSTDLVVSGGDGEIVLTRIIDTATGEERRELPRRRGRMRFSPDARFLAIGGGRGLSLIDVESWSERYRDLDLSVRDLAFSPDSQTLVAGTTEGEVRCLEIPGGQVLWTARIDDF